MATPPEPIGDEKHWFSANDYPEMPLSGGAQGTTHLLLTIGVDGRVSRCVTFGSTGNKDMDQAACKLFQARGHYRPAKDKQGQSMVSYVHEGISWVIPD